MSETFRMDKSEVIEAPRDTILEGVVIDVVKTTWEAIIDPTKIAKFENPKEEIINVVYEVKFKDRIFKNNDTFKYYEKPMSNSKLGKFLLKYDKLQVGITVKVEYSGDGIPSIRLK